MEERKREERKEIKEGGEERDKGGRRGKREERKEGGEERGRRGKR